jgi:hypothetical protein
MLGTYVYFDEHTNHLHLFRREETFMPVGTITDCTDGVAAINLWAPLVLSSLGANNKKGIQIEVSLVSLSRKSGVKLVASKSQVSRNHYEYGRTK